MCGVRIVVPRQRGTSGQKNSNSAHIDTYALPVSRTYCLRSQGVNAAVIRCLQGALPPRSDGHATQRNQNHDQQGKHDGKKATESYGERLSRLLPCQRFDSHMSILSAAVVCQLLTAHMCRYGLGVDRSLELVVDATLTHA